LEELKVPSRFIKIAVFITLIMLMAAVNHDVSLGYLSLKDSVLYMKLPFSLLLLLLVYFSDRLGNTGAHCFLGIAFAYGLINSLFVSIDYYWSLLQVFLFAVFWFGHELKALIFYFIIYLILYVLVMVYGSTPVYINPEYPFRIMYATTGFVFALVILIIGFFQYKGRYSPLQAIYQNWNQSKMLMHELRHQIYMKKNQQDSLGEEFVELFRQTENLLLEKQSNLPFEKIEVLSFVKKQLHEYGLRNFHIVSQLEESDIILMPKAVMEVVFSNIVRNMAEVKSSDVKIGIYKVESDDFIRFTFENKFKQEDLKTKSIYSSGIGHYVIKRVIDQVNGSFDFQSKDGFAKLSVELPLFELSS
jgi:hypothetical protein